MLKKLLPVLLLSATLAAPANEWAVQVKKHAEHGEFSERPYGKDDISYGAFIEASEGLAAWRLGATYVSDATGFGEADSVITPEITLLAQDGAWEGGDSTLIDYVDANDETDWGDIYFQLQLGLRLPVLKRANLGINTYYPFEKFGELGKFDFGDLDYGLSLRFRF